MPSGIYIFHFRIFFLFLGKNIMKGEKKKGDKGEKRSKQREKRSKNGEKGGGGEERTKLLRGTIKTKSYTSGGKYINFPPICMVLGGKI